MSDKIIDLATARGDRTEHLSGPARCLACGHSWTAVAPVGCAGDLECPSCGLSRGFMQFTCIKGDQIRICNCGNDLFRVNKKEIYCANCGTTQEF